MQFSRLQALIFQEKNFYDAFFCKTSTRVGKPNVVLDPIRLQSTVPSVESCKVVQTYWGERSVCFLKLPHNLLRWQFVTA